MGASLTGCCVDTDFGDEKLSGDDKTQRIILSPICKDKDVSDWKYQGLLIPHEPIRHGLNTLIELTNDKYYTSLEILELKSKINKFYTWYNDFFYFFVHHHHDMEEEYYFPWIVKKCEALPPKISKDHVQLLKMLNNIRDLQKNFQIDDVAEFKQELKKLNNLCIQLNDDTVQHLNEEEEIVPKLFTKYNITQEEELKIVITISKKLGLSGNKIMMPWIIDVMQKWGGNRIVNQFRENIPGAVILINDIFWTKHYQNNNKKVVKELMS